MFTSHNFVFTLKIFESITKTSCVNQVKPNPVCYVGVGLWSKVFDQVVFFWQPDRRTNGHIDSFWCFVSLFKKLDLYFSDHSQRSGRYLYWMPVWLFIRKRIDWIFRNRSIAWQFWKISKVIIFYSKTWRLNQNWIFQVLLLTSTAHESRFGVGRFLGIRLVYGTRRHQFAFGSHSSGRFVWC